ncbi:hypothetical protein LOTGIDRAFT_174020 [Lottia gigantea]|uniref:Uncharacterized protein n=1 Tax=Lottia gigantea TaxID=225164 RepID=V4AVG6_LOTGI|nr:hypothetical protein LOTGIDRAFT_174020 [Lottia gigantea]ESO99020.1 hypothetical protein LOTGIDRAFT_174020 [Lottia gigantea]
MELFQKLFCAALLALLPSLCIANNEYTPRPYCGLTKNIKIGLIEQPCGTPIPRNTTSTNVDLCRDTMRMRSTMKIQVRNMYNKYRNYISNQSRPNRFQHINTCLPTRASLNVTRTLRDLQIYVLGLSCIGEAMNYRGIFHSSESWIMVGRFREPSDSVWLPQDFHGHEMLNFCSETKYWSGFHVTTSNVSMRFLERVIDG